jgi:hypothetical protein
VNNGGHDGALAFAPEPENLFQDVHVHLRSLIVA